MKEENMLASLAGYSVLSGRKGDRVEIVINLVKGGNKVLDIGCTGGDMTCIVNPAKTVHAKIATASRYCVGIDIREDAIRSMKEAGFNVFLVVAEKISSTTYDSSLSISRPSQLTASD